MKASELNRLAIPCASSSEVIFAATSPAPAQSINCPNYGQPMKGAAALVQAYRAFFVELARDHDDVTFIVGVPG